MKEGLSLEFISNLQNSKSILTSQDSIKKIISSARQNKLVSQRELKKFEEN